MKIILRHKRTIILSIIIFFIGLALAIFFWTQASKFRTLETDVFAAMVLLLSVGAGALAYLWARYKDLLNVSIGRRTEFIQNSSLQGIRMKIEHNSIDLQAIVALVNISPNPYDSETLPESSWQSHEEFDDYLNYLEGVALLVKQGNIIKEDLEGSWSIIFL